MPANPKVIDRFNVDGEDYVIEPEIDPVPLQNSQRAVMSGGVWQQLHDIDIQLADTGDTAKQNSQGIFTRNGAFNYFGGSTHAMEWLGRVFADKIADNWNIFRTSQEEIIAGQYKFYSAKGMGIFIAHDSEHDGIYVSKGNIHELEKVYTPPAGSSLIGHLREVNGKLFLISHDTSLQYPVLVSDDGLNWSVLNINPVANNGSLSYVDIAYGNGIYVIGTIDYYWSDDLVNWTPCTLPEDIGTGYSSCIIYGNGVFVTNSEVSSRKTIYSNDGKVWQIVSMSPQTSFDKNTLKTVTFTGSGWVGYQRLGNERGYFYSADGANWTQSYAFPTGMQALYEPVQFLSTNQFYTAVYDSHASTYNGMLVSTDGGETWTFTAIANLTGGTRFKFFYAAGSLKRFILTSGSGDRVASGLFVQVGSSYQQATGIDTNLSIDSLAYANGIFLCTANTSSNNYLYKSFDGVNWTRVIGAGLSSHLHLCFVNGSWVGYRKDTYSQLYAADFITLSDRYYFNVVDD